MSKRWIIATVATFVAWMLGSFLVHGLLLHGEYAKLPNLFRTETDAQRYFPIMLLAHLLLAGALSWIYARGVSAGPWLAQGLRFGVAVAMLTVVPTYLIYYAVQPMPGAMVAKQIGFDGALIVLLGMLQGWLHRRAAPD